MLEAARPYYTEEQWNALRTAKIGIAGAGGLGSNAAMMLARSGICSLVLIDGDRVEARNLNRQHYFPRHVGMLKVEALAEQLRELSPGIHLELHGEWLNEKNLPAVIAAAPVWIEALDDAAMKALFVSAALRAGRNVISGCGMAGTGRTAMRRRVMRSGASWLATVGDFCSDIAHAPPLAPRVTQCAAMEADAALEWLLTKNISTLQ